MSVCLLFCLFLCLSAFLFPCLVSISTRHESLPHSSSRRPNASKAANVTVATAGQRARLPPAIPRRSRTRSAPPPSQLPGGPPWLVVTRQDPALAGSLLILSCSGSDLSLTSLSFPALRDLGLRPLDVTILLAPPRSCSGSVYVFNPAHGCFGTRLAATMGHAHFRLLRALGLRPLDVTILLAPPISCSLCSLSLRWPAPS